MRRYWLTLAMAGMLVAAGCSSDDDGGGAPSGPSESGGNSAGEASGNQQTVTTTELQGTWKSNCTDAQVFGLTEDSILQVSGETMTRVTRFHSDGGCTAPAVEAELGAAFQKKDEIKPSVFAIDIAITTAKVKPVSDTGVQILRLANFCGISDWALNVQRDVTAQTGTDRCFPKVPTTLFQIYTVDANRLLFGQTGEAEPISADKRPTEIDSENFFTKQ